MIHPQYIAQSEALERAAAGVAAQGANFHNSKDQGDFREYVVEKFLKQILPGDLGVSSGEVLEPEEFKNYRRPEIDAIIYQRTAQPFPLEGKNLLVPRDNVAGLIEVKTTLTKEKFMDTCRNACLLKDITRAYSPTPSIMPSYFPHSYPYYLIAFGGPANVETIDAWLMEFHRSPTRPQNRQFATRLSTHTGERICEGSPDLDGVFLLGKGFLYFDNTRLSHTPLNLNYDESDYNWISLDAPSRSFLWLYLQFNLRFAGGSLLPPDLDTSALCRSLFGASGRLIPNC